MEHFNFKEEFSLTPTSSYKDSIHHFTSLETNMSSIYHLYTIIKVHHNE